MKLAMASRAESNCSSVRTTASAGSPSMTLSHPRSASSSPKTTPPSSPPSLHTPAPARSGGSPVKFRMLFLRLLLDIVGEPFRLLVRVGVTPDVDEQRGVVDDRALFFVEADTLGEPQGDQALSQHVLHRLAETEVD